MIKNAMFVKKFKKVVSLCLAGSLVIGGANVKVEAAKDKTKPKISVEYHLGKKDTDIPNDWLVIKASDNVEVEKVEFTGDYVNSGYTSASKKKKTCVAQFRPDSEKMKITVTDSAGNTKEVTVNKKKRDSTVFVKKLSKTFEEELGTIYFLDGKKLKAKNGKIKVSTTKSGLHILNKASLSGVHTTFYYVDKTKPVVKCKKFEGPMADFYDGKGKEITVKDSTVCSIEVVYNDGTREEIKYGLRKVILPGKGPASGKTPRSAVVFDSCGNKKTINIK